MTDYTSEHEFRKEMIAVSWAWVNAVKQLTMVLIALVLIESFNMLWTFFL